jgi:hypothetical protein
MVWAIGNGIVNEKSARLGKGLPTSTFASCGCS